MAVDRDSVGDQSLFLGGAMGFEGGRSGACWPWPAFCVVRPWRSYCNPSVKQKRCVTARQAIWQVPNQHWLPSFGNGRRPLPQTLSRPRLVLGRRFWMLHESDSDARVPVQIYDTTLRDGTQGEGISLSCQDKIRIATELDTKLGVAYIEAGWPGSNPKDELFFQRAKQELSPSLRHAKLVAFGATRHKCARCETDPQLAALLRAETPTVTIVAKVWDFQVLRILGTTLEENLSMILETVAFLKAANREVMLDAEHFFDAFRANPTYAMRCLETAVTAGVDVLVLCDTNGAATPWDIEQAVTAVRRHIAAKAVRLGIHCHNDMEMAVANSVAAVRAGATIVQGCANGYGERTGNANLMSLIPVLQLQLGYAVVPSIEHLRNLTAVSRFVDEVANRPHVPWRPFVGESAFAHKGGLHVAAMLKDARSYQFMDPSIVGNRPRVLVSELSGRGNIQSKLRSLNLAMDDKDPVWKARIGQVLERVKLLENKGFTFEGAEASLAMMWRRAASDYSAPFELLDFSVYTGNKRVLFVNHEGCFTPQEDADGGLAAPAANSKPLGQELFGSGRDPALTLTGGPLFVTPPGNTNLPAWNSSRELARDPSIAVWRNETHTHAVIKVLVHGAAPVLECAEGNGPVDAVNGALRRALLRSFPALEQIILEDYKVRILDSESATAAITRVMVSFHDRKRGIRYTTVSADTNIIVASVNALVDGLEYALHLDAVSMSSQVAV
jgi:2-isopropylmalate synthase